MGHNETRSKLAPWLRYHAVGLEVVWTDPSPEPGTSRAQQVSHAYSFMCVCVNGCIGAGVVFRVLFTGSGGS